MHIGRQAVACAAVAFLMVTGSAVQSRAQDHDGHGAPAAAAAPQKLTQQQNDLVALVKIATERFRHVTRQEQVGDPFVLLFGCVSGGDFGAMGLHYLNGALLKDGLIDVTKPEIVLFEPTPNGGIRITGADFLVFAADWDAKHSGPPELMGQLFHLFDSPNRFGLPPFYTLHVWAWKDNPAGAFTNWHPKVSCDSYAGK